MTQKRSKRYTAIAKPIERGIEHPPAEAVKLVKASSNAKFDETVELHLRMGVDPKHADQVVRGASVLPHGTGKTVRVVVFAQGDRARDAKDAPTASLTSRRFIDVKSPITSAIAGCSGLRSNRMRLTEKCDWPLNCAKTSANRVSSTVAGLTPALLALAWSACQAFRSSRRDNRTNSGFAMRLISCANGRFGAGGNVGSRLFQYCLARSNASDLSNSCRAMT